MPFTLRVASPMFMHAMPPSASENVYHLVLMGEVGEGTIEFLVKTTFGGALSPLTSPHKVTPSDVTEIAYMTNTTELENATLLYTIDSWKNVTRVEMVVSNVTCNAMIP